MKKIANFLFKLIPSNSKFLYKIADRYVDQFNGDNNCDFKLNGESRFLSSVLSKSKRPLVIFDVGANVGDWSKSCLNVSPKVEIHLFEPSATTFTKLINYSWPKKNVKLNNYGCGEKSEQLSLNIFAEFSGMNSLYARRGIKENKIVRTEKVNICTIDEYSKRHQLNKINLMKIDAEGHELSILKGAKKFLSEKRVEIIQFEYGGANIDSRVHLGDIWDFLESYGYNIAKILPHKIQYYDSYEQGLEVFKYSNWLAIKR